jgi:hypothetical protein
MSLEIHRLSPLSEAAKNAPPPPGPWLVHKVGTAKSTRASSATMMAAVTALPRLLRVKGANAIAA